MKNEELGKTVDELQAKVIKARELLQAAEEIIVKINMENFSNTELTQIKNDMTDWMKRRAELWCRIHNEGGVISQEKLYEIWELMGQDKRGLGGFFTGGSPSLVYVSFGGKTCVGIGHNVPTLIKNWSGVQIEDFAKTFQ